MTSETSKNMISTTGFLIYRRSLGLRNFGEILENNVANVLSGALKKQKYHLVGNHSAVKRCKWLYESIINDRPCYKQRFYGIKSHRCIQMSPSLYFCTQECLFCWRAQSGDLQISWDEMKIPKIDSPEEIVDGCFKAQEKILQLY